MGDGELLFFLIFVFPFILSYIYYAIFVLFIFYFVMKMRFIQSTNNTILNNLQILIVINRCLFTNYAERVNSKSKSIFFFKHIS